MTESTGKKLWDENLPTEIRYWETQLDFLKTQGGNTPLNPWIKELFGDECGVDISILDVGPGPFAGIGTLWEGKNVKVVAVDPLADEYSALLAEHDITLQYPILQGNVENLLELFSKKRFDFVYCSNALDHSFDPLLGLSQMLEVVKPGHCVALNHRVNEAERCRYRGLHQWNFCKDDDGELLFWNKEERVVVSEVFNSKASIECFINAESDEVRAVVRKI